jgi:tyrosyl-tRNA synthetase
MPAAALDDGGLEVVDALAASGLVASKSAARTALAQGGAYVNNRRVGVDRRLTRADLVAGRYVVLRRGRRDHQLLRFD